jgi:hypothetical protein
MGSSRPGGSQSAASQSRLHYAPSTVFLLSSLVLASWSLGLLPSPEDQCRINKRCIRPSSLILVSSFVPVKGRPDSTTPLYYRGLPRYRGLGSQSPLLTTYPPWPGSSIPLPRLVCRRLAFAAITDACIVNLLHSSSASESSSRFSLLFALFALFAPFSPCFRALCSLCPQHCVIATS